MTASRAINGERIPRFLEPVPSAPVGLPGDGEMR